MDILISLLYTGVQDGWVTINGRARQLPENRQARCSPWRPSGGRGGGLPDDASHLGPDFPCKPVEKNANIPR